jgi:hypothetical protein
MPKTPDDLSKRIRAEARVAGPAAMAELRAIDRFLTEDARRLAAEIVSGKGSRAGGAPHNKPAR